MKIISVVSLALIIAASCISVSAIDYRADASFISPLDSSDEVYDAYPLPDGKVLIAGEISVGGSNTIPYVRRLNANGTVDPSFNVPIVAGSGSGYVRTIQPLANGQFLITGDFYLNSARARFARINSDGSIDSTLAVNSSSFNAVALPDGKIVACGDPVIGGQTYRIAHRLNSNGTYDPSFRITWADGLSCPTTLKGLPDGKILIHGVFTSGGQTLKQLYRLNVDGTIDPTFDAEVVESQSVGDLAILPDGKLLIWNVSAKRLNADGSLDLIIPNCSGRFLALDADSNYLMTNCKKWASGPSYFVSRVSPGGLVDGTLDDLASGSFRGLRGDGNNTFYAFGGIDRIHGVSSEQIIRLIPDTAPPKASYDFDGDGRSDLAVYRPADGIWYLYQSTAGISYVPWGFPGDKLAAGDADRDGKTDVAIFRDGTWHALTSGTGNYRFMCLGQTGDKPMVIQNYTRVNPGDVSVVRGMRSGAIQWFFGSVLYGNCSNQGTQLSLASEQPSDKPVAGDFNGDSISEVGYFRDGYWYTAERNSSQAPASFQWGSAGDIPVPGDYDGDRQTDYAIYRPSTGEWWINRTTAGVIVLHFGFSTDIPVPADYDGDGKLDIAIYRDGTWWQFLSGTGTVAAHQWGTAADIPIPAQNQQ